MGKGLRRSMKMGAEPQRSMVVNKVDYPIRAKTITQDASGTDGFGSVVIGDLPEGNILFLGATAYIQFSGTGSDADLADTWEGSYGIGSTATADNTIATTEENFITEVHTAAATAEVSPVTRGEGNTSVMLDNTDGSLEINLNLIIDDADIAGIDSVITCEGNLSMVFIVLMDD